MISITLIDEVNCHIEMDNKKHYNVIRESMKLPIAGSFMTAAYQLKLTDGMECLIDPDGFTYQHFLEDIMDMLAELGYDEQHINFIDDRQPISLPSDLIDENYLIDEINMPLRDIQVRCINSVISNRNGVLDAATSSGKTIITVALCKYYQDHLKGLVIVPNVNLAKQTFADFKKAGIDAVIVGDKMKKIDQRIAAFKNHKNIILTYKLLHNLLQYEDENDMQFISNQRFAILYDEVHEFGETMFDAFKYKLNQSPVRVGMSGSLPKDKLKIAKIFGSLGGGVIERVKVDELKRKKFVSDLFISFIVLNDSEVNEIANNLGVKQELWSWDREEQYYNSAKVAVGVVNVLSELEPMNTLVLCRPELGKKIGGILGLPSIDKDTDPDERGRLFAEFRTRTDLIRIASFDTSATGISENDIKRIVLIDAGKNETWIKQGVGRGIRLDGKDNFTEIIDICCNTYYSKEKHKKERKRLYVAEKFAFSKNEVVIEI